MMGNSLNIKYKACLFTFFVNVILAIAKLVVGVVSGSYAVIIDGFHSASDAISDILIFISIYLGSKPRDASHPYGHGKIETFLSSILGLLLLNIGFNISYQCVKRFLQGEFVYHENVMLLPVVIFSILIKEFLYRLNNKVSRETGSVGLFANAWHNRSDALSSLLVLFSVIGVRLGWPILDVIAGVLISLFLSWMGIKILIKTGRELVETNADLVTLDLIKSIAEQPDLVRSAHEVNARYVGQNLVVEVHLVVSPLMSVEQAHSITKVVEQNIRERLSHVKNVLIHVDPYDDREEDLAMSMK